MDDFRSRVVGVCEELFAATGHDAVANACRRIKALAGEKGAQPAQYRVLRELVRDAAPDGQRTRYTRLVALHDMVLREHVLAPGTDPAGLTLFDEAFYLEVYPDIAAVVQKVPTRHFNDLLRNTGARTLFAHAQHGFLAQVWRCGRFGPAQPLAQGVLQIMHTAH